MLYSPLTNMEQITTGISQINLNQQNMNSVKKDMSLLQLQISQLFDDINKSNIYKLNASMLNNSEITEQMRAKLRDLLYHFSYNSPFSARTGVLACYLMDFYLSKDHNISREMFYDFGISCLSIANKIENSILMIHKDQKKQKYVELQALICSKLEFNLNPVTYTDISSALIYSWNEFVAKNQKFIMNKNQKQYQILCKCKKIKYAGFLLEQWLQFLFHILKSLDYSMENLVVNAFYLILCLQIYNIKSYIKDTNFNKFYENQNNYILNIMNEFIIFFNKSEISTIQISSQYGSFLCQTYNALISQFDESIQKKSLKCFFNLNNQIWSMNSQDKKNTRNIKNKYKSFKIYKQKFCNKKLKIKKVKKIQLKNNRKTKQNLKTKEDEIQIQ